MTAQIRAASYFDDFRTANRNCHLNFATTVLYGVAQGIYLVTFNLYILALGIEVSVLGVIASAAPLAQAIGSIPIGFLGERIGYRKAFVIIYGVAGIALVFQVSTSSTVLIAGAGFISGLALAGDFVVRIPFLAVNSPPQTRAKIFSFSTFIFSFSLAIGSLVAGSIPSLFLLHSKDLVSAYRYTLYLSGALTLLGVVPSLFVTEQIGEQRRKISLSPYLWGMDRFTGQQGLISLFDGVTIGLTIPFMNLYFIFYLDSSREFYSIASALALGFAMVGTLIAPLIAIRMGPVSSVTGLRLLVPIALLTLAFTSSQFIGATAFWAQNTLTQMAQPLSFAFAMYAASERTRTAISAWLNVTYWLGNAIAAPIAGSFFAQSAYRAPLLIAAITIIVAAGLNQRFFIRLERAGREASQANERPSSSGG